MKKVFSLLLLCIVTSSLYSQHKVKFIVKQQTPIQNDSIYISGTFNNYLDKPDAKYKLQSAGKNVKTITLDLEAGDYDYTFHRGNFDKEERATNGLFIKSRKFTVKKDTVISIVIENWKDQLPFMPIFKITKEIIENNGYSQLGEMNIWYFKQGHNAGWAKGELDTSDWVIFRPVEMDEKQADHNGRREAWFRTNFKIDNSLVDTPINFKFGLYGAGEVYLDGKLIKSFGNTGKDKKTYKAYTSSHHLPFQFTLDTSKVHVLAIHAVDYVLPLINKKHNKGWYFQIWDQKGTDEYAKHIEEEPFFNTIWLSVGTLLCLLFWSLAFQNRKEKNMWLIALTSSSLLAYSICVWMPHNAYASKLLLFLTNDYFLFITDKFLFVFGVLLVVNLFKRKVTQFLKVILSIILLSAVVDILYTEGLASLIGMILTLLINCYYVISSRNSLKGAQWFIVAGVLLTYLLALTFGCIGFLNLFPITSTIAGLFYTGFFLSLPVCLLFYIVFRFKEFINEVQYNSQEVLKLSEEKKLQALNQQKLLEEEVARQTVELRTSLENLKSTQSQLIQSEKMASLGELTAGIAHEIQNPLNFVNNFSEVNKELLIELKEEIKNGNLEEVNSIADDVISNEEKINHHGKRADAIVKGMLQHSRSTSAVKEPTDINKLADEYLRLAYHGLRAKDKSFNATMKTDFDATIGNIEIIPQDMGRVILNLITNAFYATNEKQALRQVQGENYEPTVTVGTKKVGDTVEISVKDNGNGIPQSAIDKIFQPFFTTKPTGQGTGLGLSLSYDIVKAHGGELKVETVEGDGTTFIISLHL
jgi:two-component system NtrC family sensor kinase